ncbi:MAG: hypothetical protein RLZZ196_2768 [Bacteroidota bacterium]
MATKRGHAASNISGARSELDAAKATVATSIKEVENAANVASKTSTVLDETSTPVKNLSRAIKSEMIHTGLEEGRAHSFSLALASRARNFCRRHRRS